MPPVPPVLLLPPSEGKRPGGTGVWEPEGGAFASLAPWRRKVAEQLEAAMATEAGAAKLLGVTGKALAAARAADLRVSESPVLPAWQRYSGVVWEHLDVASLPAAAKRRAMASIVVLSGLLGAVALADPVPDYKLKMGARLPALGVLSSAWRGPVTDALAERCRGAVVVNLLPAEHARAVDFDALLASGARRVVHVEFRTAAGRAVGHFAKAAKGAFTRHLLGGADPLRMARSFEWDGWSCTPGPRSVLFVSTTA